MSAWPIVSLGEVCEQRTGSRDPKRQPDETFHYVDISSIDNQKKKIVDTKLIRGVDAPSRARKNIKTDDVLVSMTRPNLNSVAMVSPVLDDQICSTGFSVLRSNGKALPDYIFHFVTSRRFIDTISGLVSGAMYPAVTEAQVKGVKLLLPPLPEQRRTVDILNRANGIRRLRREAQEKAHQFIPALFVEMFGDPATNPKGWPVAKLAEVCRFIGGSSLPAGNEFNSQDGGSLLLKVGDLNMPGNELTVSKANLWSGEAIRGQFLCEPEAVVFPKRGVAIATNKKRLLVRRAALDPNLMGVKPQHDKLDGVYLLAWFNSFDLVTIQSGTTVPQLNKKDLAPLDVPVPPLGLQRTFRERFTEIQALFAQQDRMAQAADDLMASLMALAFGGKLGRPV